MFGWYGQNWQTQTMWTRLQRSRQPTLIVSRYREIPSAQTTLVVTPQTTSGWGTPFGAHHMGYGVTTGTKVAIAATVLTGGMAAPVAIPVAVLSELRSVKHRCKILRSKYEKLKIKGAPATKLAKIKKKYKEACKLYALKKSKVRAEHKAKAHKKEARKEGRVQRRGERKEGREDRKLKRKGLPGEIAPDAFEPVAAVATTADGDLDEGDLEAAVDEAPLMTTGGGVGGMLAAVPTWVWIAGAGAVVLGLLALGAKGKGGKGFKFGGGRKSESAPAV